MDLEPQRSQRAQRGTEGIDLRAASAAAVDYPHKELTEQIIGAAIEVHKELGPGFLEKVCENALKIELTNKGLEFASQVPIPVSYKGQVIGSYYADLVVARTVVCEIKAVDNLIPIHESQLIHYLKATGYKIGLLLNFGQSKTQIKRLIS